MNARSRLWGETIDNEKGMMFERLLLNEDIMLLNSENPTHYHQQTGTYTTIDLSICSSDCFIDFSHQVTDNLRGSDHYPIKIEKTLIPEIGEPSFRYKTEKGDWPKFRNLTSSYCEPNFQTNINELVDHLTSFFYECCPAINSN